MKVLQVNSFFYGRGGGETHFMDLLDLLGEAGEELSVVAMAHPSNIECSWPHEWLPHVPHETGQNLRGATIALGRALYSPDVARRVQRFATCRQIDVAHLHGIHHHLSLAVIEGLRRASVPIVWTLHDYRTVCPASSLLRDGAPCEACSDSTFWHALQWRCRGGAWGRSFAACAESYLTAWASRYEHVDCFVSPSRFLARKVLAMGLPARRVEVLRNFYPSSQRQEGGERSGALFVGRLSKEKGVDVLVRAVARVPAAQLTVIGDGPERTGLEALAESLGAAVDFRGWVDRASVLGAMRSATLLCVPSISYENCPIVVLEAMGNGLPFAVSTIGGLPELAMGGECGLIVRPGSVDDWARVVRQASENSRELTTKADRAALALDARHSPKLFVARLRRLYAEAIESHRARTTRT